MGAAEEVASAGEAIAGETEGVPTEGPTAGDAMATDRTRRRIIERL